MMLSYYEFTPYENINYFRSVSKFLSLPLLNFGSIAVFAVLGMFFISKSDRSWAAPLYVFVIVYFISLLPFLPLARYRLAMVPFLIIFAAYSIVNISEAIRLRKGKYLLKYAFLFLPVFIITNSDIMLAYSKSFSRPDYYKGRAYMAMGDTAKALTSLDEALHKHTNDADIYEARGDVFQQLGELNNSEVNYKKALEIESDFPEAMEKLAIVYAKKDDLDKAIELLEKTLSSFPVEYASTHVNLATCYTLKGDTEGAKEELERALKLEPDNLQALYKIAELYERSGDPKAAEFRARFDEISQKYSEKL
jgi:Tfp pilus assembly protein PilF